MQALIPSLCQRIGLVDKEAFTSFSKEVIMLATLENEYIIEFLGYVLEPVLLIVMEFAEGGTLRDVLLNARKESTPLSFANTMKILMGTCVGIEYLHSHEPMPILHRDIKSENVLLTNELEPRVADFGEARAM